MFSKEVIDRIMTEIWSTILGLEVDPVDEAPPIGAGEATMIGCVQVTGDWEGAVTLYCSESLARKATSAMFEIDMHDVVDEEVQDALGELANMTAGNIKSLLPGNCRISLPSVAQGIHYKLTVPGGKIVSQHAYRHTDQPLLVTILERA